MLRALALDDAPVIYALSQEPGMRQWLPDQVYADVAQAESALRYLCAQSAQASPATAPFVLGVCAVDGTLVGHVGLSAARDGVEIGYAIGYAHRGHGLATAAVREMTRRGLDAFGLPHVDGVVAADNADSCRVLEKAGFTLVAEATRPLHGVVRLVRTYRIVR